MVDVKRVLASSVLAYFLIAPILPVADGIAATAASDSGGCVTHGEYDALGWGLSVDQVQNRFDTNGSLLGTGEDFFRRGYNACWTPDRVVVWFDLNLGLSDHWDVR